MIRENLNCFNEKIMLEEFIEPQCSDDFVFFSDYENCEEPLNIGQKPDSVLQHTRNVFLLILSFLLFVVCVILTVWMIYNFNTYGSVFPPDQLSSVDLIPKSVKGFKL